MRSALTVHFLALVSSLAPHCSGIYVLQKTYKELGCKGETMMVEAVTLEVAVARFAPNATSGCQSVPKQEKSVQVFADETTGKCSFKVFKDSECKTEVMVKALFNGSCEHPRQPRDRGDGGRGGGDAARSPRRLGGAMHIDGANNGGRGGNHGGGGGGGQGGRMSYECKTGKVPEGISDSTCLTPQDKEAVKAAFWPKQPRQEMNMTQNMENHNLANMQNQKPDQMKERPSQGGRDGVILGCIQQSSCLRFLKQGANKTAFDSFFQEGGCASNCTEASKSLVFKMMVMKQRFDCNFKPVHRPEPVPLRRLDDIQV